MTGRAAAGAAFIAATDWHGATISPLAGDASPRRYFRVAKGAERAVLMDADPQTGEDVRPFAAITALLRDRGFSAPALLAADATAGFLLIEDLGDDLFARLCARDTTSEAALYEAAIDLLAALHAAPPPAVAPAPAGLDLPAHIIPPYDGTTLLREARLITDWWTPLNAAPLSADALAAFDAALMAACAPVAATTEALVLRDYHAENLLWLPGRTGHARVGLLDYQDALRGHPAYDVISLLEDARRDVSPSVAAAMRARYCAATGWDGAAFEEAAAILAAQRNLKIVGIFARLAKRDGKPAYLSLIPRVWRLLMQDLAHPALASLAALVARLIPAPTPPALARAKAAAQP